MKTTQTFSCVILFLSRLHLAEDILRDTTGEKKPHAYLSWRKQIWRRYPGEKWSQPVGTKSGWRAGGGGCGQGLDEFILQGVGVPLSDMCLLKHIYIYIYIYIYMEATVRGGFTPACIAHQTETQTQHERYEVKRFSQQGLHFKRKLKEKRNEFQNGWIISTYLRVSKKWT